MEEGIVIKSTGSWYQVKLSDGRTVPCRILGKFRLEGLNLTNPVAVGDQVEVIMEDGEEETGLIRNIKPRTNYVVRQSPRRKRDMHLLASNIDQAMVIVTIREPMLKPGFIDRFLLMTEPYEIPTLIIFNKADLYSEDDLELYEAIEYMYEDIGYQVFLVSAVSGQGIEELRGALKDKITLVAGQSGVGKSTLVTAIQPQLELRTQDLSGHSGKGQHTTTFAEMFDLDFGGAIIDTPGIKTLSFNHLEPQDVAHNFREFFALSEDCRFGGSCLHRDEPGCAVKEAVEEQQVSELRYMNYLMLLEEIEEQNYWERNKG
ncbi:ribosome small subunit-dependent GTPase A [Flavilitoribacter nigricans]|uniref:Small ribosomal subunit biogenesis GTPase RsgA n=1 Tax=Flavilitoribacter nigricans (strain ATCC 23147 / DSM 23189 / NBRC 102662 / NCIMB 1420 / SS-2) TaxID=1122177 RepID=A0A2D0N8M9_FLAN2|nr:ribosome small subunit-dependent GTPase A [Flavilitoribacter nigricans]PHN04862.1 ribosome small subunit-dependent GTPase A [Flavilitoribacter nigricans DSM 23189 = NBRC 102662]